MQRFIITGLAAMLIGGMAHVAWSSVGPGWSSCINIRQIAATDPEYLPWLMGFMTGFRSAKPPAYSGDLVTVEEKVNFIFETLQKGPTVFKGAAWMDSYCRLYPNKNLTEAATAMSNAFYDEEVARHPRPPHTKKSNREKVRK
jgi:hypothetical protein